MKCYMVRDLLPEFTEHLCSPETTREIEEHLRSCDDCRQIWAEITQEQEAISTSAAINNEEIRPFLKIQKKLRQNRITKFVAIALFVLAFGVFGTLTVGQLFPTLPAPSYDSLMYRFQAKQIAQTLVDGNIDEILNKCIVSPDPALLFFINNYRIFFNDVSDHITELRDKAFGSKDVKITLKEMLYAESPHTDAIYSAYKDEFYYEALLLLQAGDETVSMQIRFFNRYSYTIYVWAGDAEYADRNMPASEDENSLTYVIQEMERYLAYFESVVSRYSEDQHYIHFRISNENAQETAEESEENEFTEEVDDTGALLNYGEYFTTDCLKLGKADEDGATAYSRQVGTQIDQILKSCKSDRFDFVHEDYNEDVKKYEATLYWTITDLNGKTCNLIKSFYYGPTGYEPVDNNEQIVADDGFDTGLRKQLEQVFDS